MEEPEVCEGCDTGRMERVDIEYSEGGDVIKRWKALPCSLIKMTGKIKAARLQYCYHHYPGKK